MNQTNQKRILILAADAAAALCAVLCRWVAGEMIRWLPDCVFSSYGITCPACGGTRCIMELLSGHWGAAFRLHPVVFCLCFYLAAAGVLLNIGYLIPRPGCQRVGKAMLGVRAIILLSVIYALFGITRMLLTLP